MKIYRARGKTCAVELLTEDSYNESSKNKVRLLEC